MPATDSRSPSCALCHGALEESLYKGFVHALDLNDKHRPVLVECHVCLEPLHWYLPIEAMDGTGEWQHLSNDLDYDHDATPVERTVTPGAQFVPPDHDIPAMGWLRGDAHGRPSSARLHSEHVVKPTPSRRRDLRRWLGSRRHREALVLGFWVVVMIAWGWWILGFPDVVSVLLVCSALVGAVALTSWWVHRAPRS